MSSPEGESQLALEQDNEFGFSAKVASLVLKYKSLLVSLFQKVEINRSCYESLEKLLYLYRLENELSLLISSDLVTFSSYADFRRNRLLKYCTLYDESPKSFWNREGKKVLKNLFGKDSLPTYNEVYDLFSKVVVIDN